MKKILILSILAAVLGGCSSSHQQLTASLGDGEIAKLDADITPKEDKSRLIDALSKIKLNHHKDALREIEGAR